MPDEIVKEDITIEEEEEFEQDQYLVFTIRSQQFGFQALRVQEITPVLGITSVPNAPSYIEGMLNLRGRLATVINFRKKLSFESKDHDEDTRIIVAEYDGFPVGILVDNVEEVLRIPKEKVQTLPASTTVSTSDEEEYVSGVGMLDNRLIILLDLDKVMTKTELVEIDTIQQAIEKAQDKTEAVEMDITQQVIDSDQTKSELVDEGASEQTMESAQTEETPEKAESSEAETSQPTNPAQKKDKREAR